MDQFAENKVLEVKKEKSEKFSLPRVLKVLLGILILFLIGFGSFYIFTIRTVKVFLTDQLFHQRMTYLSCYDMPFYEQVQKVYSSHAKDVESLKKLGAKEVDAIETDCSGWAGGLTFVKGDILIVVATNDQRKQVEKYLEKDFFGMPYRLQIVK